MEKLKIFGLWMAIVVFGVIGAVLFNYEPDRLHPSDAIRSCELFCGAYGFPFKELNWQEKSMSCLCEKRQ